MSAIGKQCISEHGRLWAIENLISGFMARSPVTLPRHAPKDQR
ncbi:MAG: hypothetical protein RRA35_02385 [Desulfomonilia bacterium]|nr:hypothetical protein [Desulfomonilia bacterium]